MSYKVQYSKDVIEVAIRKIAFSINTLISHFETEDIIILTVIEGGSYLTGKIMDLLPFNYRQRVINKSIKISSYHGQKQGEISFDYIPDIDFKDKIVVVLDDFCDSGHTINKLHEYLKSQGVQSVQFYTLLGRKGYQVNKDVKLRCGIIDDTDHFYIGCGLDDDDKSRFLDEIVYNTKIYTI